MTRILFVCHGSICRSPMAKYVLQDMVDKKEAVEAKMKAIHQAYCGVSRAITVKMENNNELRMTGNRYVNIA